MDYVIGNIVTLKKGHPCGTNEWEVIRTGADWSIEAGHIANLIDFTLSFL